ncbi:cyclopropane-fatty-acyl-phospholipid synthase family protein [Leptospira sp. WS39.C2]
MTPFPFSKSPVTDLSQKPPYYVSNFGFWTGVTDYREAGIQFLDEFAKQCGLEKNKSILEVGSGLGGSLVYWKDQYEADKLSAINLPGEQSNFAKQLFHDQNLEVTPFLEGGWEGIKTLPSNSYDYVFSVDAAYHFNPIDEFYRESYRILKPGGKLVFNVFHLHEIEKKKYSGLLSFFLIPPNQVKVLDVTVEELQTIGYLIEKNLDWTIPVINGFVQNKSKMKLLLQIFGFVLQTITKTLKLSYHYYVVQKPI